MALQKIGDDYEGLVYLVAHELYHTIQQVGERHRTRKRPPIAAAIAAALEVNPDRFLMAVAIGAACDFLTPIGHQCNTLVMGPGGYKFSDYPRLGAPLSLIVILVAVPMILLVWPLR